MNRDSYEYESEELDEDQEEKRKKIIKGIFFFVFIVVIVIVALLLLRGCGKNEVNRYDELLKAAKKYYEEEKNELPELYGEQVTITLKDLKDAKVIENVDAFNDCTDASTYVKVSKLSNGKYQYTPVLNCSDEETAFGSCMVGKESDLEADSSNVEFLFASSRLQRGIKEYYPTKNTNESNVKEYYKTAPNAEYNLTDDKGVSGYKYYKTVPGSKVYWNNGAYAETAPSGFNLKGASKVTTLYRTKYVARYMFLCKGNNTPGRMISEIPCQSRPDDFTVPDSDTAQNTQGVIASCDGKTIVQKETVCKEDTAWTTEVCDQGDKYLLTGKRCEKRENVTMYQWYKETSAYNQYYPSNKTNANEEITYYVESPGNGYIKDESSKATVYRFYKFTELKEDDTTTKDVVEDWIKINEKPVTKDEMLKSLEELKYEVKTLKDIEENNNLKYEVVLKYCNRK